MKTVILVAAIAATVGVWLSPSSAYSQEATPNTDPLVAACSIASGAAQAAGLVMEKCRRTGQSVVGNQALVDIRVKISTIGWFNVKVWLMQSTWAQTGFIANPA